MQKSDVKLRRQQNSGLLITAGGKLYEARSMFL